LGVSKLAADFLAHKYLVANSAAKYGLGL